ncbi:MAG TPA: hypothetical protein VLE89_04585 [Chlamydiales bacterium]|nr:hypothetical protein [Chlamydiales bacterium]
MNAINQFIQYAAQKISRGAHAIGHGIPAAIALIEKGLLSLYLINLGGPLDLQGNLQDRVQHLDLHREGLQQRYTVLIQAAQLSPATVALSM